MREILLPEADNQRIQEAAQIVEKDIPIALRSYDIDEAMIRVRDGEYSGMVLGVTHTSADVLRGAFRNQIPLADGRKYISSFFIMENDQERLIFADCAVIPSPNVDQLVDITLATAESARLLGLQPRVALLSFSTLGSAESKHTGNIRLAADELKQRSLDFVLDGEIQFDAAYDINVARNKAADSPFAEESANVFIFPDLNSGNIAYKMTQWLGKYKATGPILQGFKYPINDLSRSAQPEEIARVIRMTFMQAQHEA
jgi:phosphate acetyltransferase